MIGTNQGDVMKGESRGLVFRQLISRGTLSLVGMCLLVTAVGCSSRLHTTVMSETQAPRNMAQAEVPPSPVDVAETAPPAKETSTGSLTVDIPVEEPARPTIRSSAAPDIFAATRSEEFEPPKAPAPPAPVVGEPDLTPSSAVSEAPQAAGISPLVIEPEKPALPTIRGPLIEEVVPPQDLVAKVEPEQVQELSATQVPEEPQGESPEMSPPPVEVAKVIPPTPETVEKILQPLKDVFFDYDRFAIRPDAAKVLKDNASNLIAGLSDKSLVIEGHCDERGTSSYNMVLGERRANAVKEFLIHLGVKRDKLKVVSYGKERPFCTEQTPECWQENRRGHFVVK